ncbi:MAG: YciI family protein [Nitrospirae bacterium]|nr:MAG: hypothetical protein D084_Lepto4C00320G0005 [Leptospirillum sp. Group IV 'UBA BS']MCL4484887.1 YciI family protein [Nitrospirota bacterium]MCL5284516.1 YciI family protein [Nitrospirota bacterium]
MEASFRYFVVHVVYLKPFSEIEPLVPPHRAFLDGCVKDGSLLLSGPLVPRTGGLLLMRGRDRGEIESLLSGDPYAKAGVARHDLQEFQPVKACPELSGLLAGG